MKRHPADINSVPNVHEGHACSVRMLNSCTRDHQIECWLLDLNWPHFCLHLEAVVNLIGAKGMRMAHEMKAFSPKLNMNPEVLVFFRKVFGEQCCQCVLEALCKPPRSTCLRINTLRTIAKEAVAELSSLLSADVTEVPMVPCAVSVRGTGPHTIDYNQEGLKEVIIDCRAGEAVLRGADVYVPGVLACSRGLDIGEKVAVSIALQRPGSDWCGITRGTTFDSEGDLPVDAVDRTNLYLGIGESLVTRTQVFRERKGVAIRMTERVYNLPPCSGVMPGKAALQNLPSVVAAMVLDPQPGWRVIDMCAAPGGKTTAIAQIMEDTGEVIALDRTHTKANQVMDYAEEFGHTCIKAYKMDACKAVWKGAESVQGGRSHFLYNPKVIARMERKAAKRKELNLPPVEEVRTAEQCKGFEAESFDGVLLDAPCSAMGLRPRLLHRHTMQELLNTAQYQKNLLDEAVQLVKPGGTLVFSTCTINPGENEQNVRYVLDKYPFMVLDAQVPRLGGHGLMHFSQPSDSQQEPQRWLSPEESAMVQRFDPSSELDTIGFFIAKFKKLKH